jgi:serine/threonine-protein kinase
MDLQAADDLKVRGRNAEGRLNPAERQVQDVFTFGPFRFDRSNGLFRDGTEVPLPPRAIAVMAALVAQPGVLISKQALLELAWPDTFVTEASLLEAIRLLRDALGDDRRRPAYIQTVHRRGYRFVAPVEAVPHTSPGSRNAAVGGRPANRWRPALVAPLVGLSSLAAGALVFSLVARPPAPRPTMRFSIALPDHTGLDPSRGSIAFSADGRRLVYAAIEQGRSRLFLRSVDRDRATRIDGSDDATDPFFSPDGEWIGFFAHGSLKKLPVGGGRAIVLSAARSGAGATWSADGTIVFGGGPGGGLARVSAEGGEPVVLAAPVAGSRDVRYGWPELLPDGRSVLYTVLTPADSAVALLDLATGQRRVLLEAAAFARWSPTGHLIVERRGRLEAAPFSLTERALTAPPQAVVRGVASGDVMDGPRFAFSGTGALVYVPGRTDQVDDRLHWLDRRGRSEPVPLPPVPLASVDVAPDRRRLALTFSADAGAGLWVGDLTRGSLSRLTTEGISASPTWRPDGLEIAFAYSKVGPFNIFVRPLDGDPAPAPLIESPWNQVPTSWSSDGRRLAYTEYHPLTGADVWLYDLQTRTRRPLVRTLFDESRGRFSPDGRWLAFMSNESGRWEVFVRAVDAAEPRVQVSAAGGAWPCWSVDGRVLYFSAGGRAVAATVETSPTLAVSALVVMGDAANLQTAGALASPDRVLVREIGSTPTGHELRVVVEWFAELTRLMERALDS